MFLNRLFQDRYPSLDWIQVEISSSCNADCIYCPHSAYRSNWRDQFLSIDAFSKLRPALRNTTLVYLQGWGEPFTHAGFFDMLKIAKDVGCRVGTTTNGTLLNDDIIKKLVWQGLDVIGFSLAGVDEKNDKIRRGTRIKTVLESIEKIHRAKSKYGTDNPEIHIAYMLLRSGLDDLVKLPGFLGNIGAAQTVVSSLSLVVSPAMGPESILAGGSKEYSELKSRLLEVGRQAAKRGAETHFHIVSPWQKRFSCSENIPHAVIVGSDGSISPCVMKQIPVIGKNFHYCKNRKHLLQNLDFGSIFSQSLDTIWHKKDFQQFILEHNRDEVPDHCGNCLKKCIDNFA